VNGRDLSARVAVPLTTAVLGGDVPVTTLGGKSLRLKIPEATQPGQRFRLRGHGLPPLGATGEAGDLYVTVDVELPRSLSDEERRHYQALQALGK
jgi:DnaJ-class molecular chaperone